MSLQSLPSRNLSDSDPITPWEPKNYGGRKAYVLLCILMSMFPNFHIFWSTGTFLSKNINVLPRWLINPPIYVRELDSGVKVTIQETGRQCSQLQKWIRKRSCIPHFRPLEVIKQNNGELADTCAKNECRQVRTRICRPSWLRCRQPTHRTL